MNKIKKLYKEIPYIIASICYTPFLLLDMFSGPSTYGGSGTRLQNFERFFGIR